MRGSGPVIQTAEAARKFSSWLLLSDIERHMGHSEEEERGEEPEEEEQGEEPEAIFFLLPSSCSDLYGLFLFVFFSFVFCFLTYFDFCTKFDFTGNHMTRRYFNFFPRRPLKKTEPDGPGGG